MNGDLRARGLLVSFPLARWRAGLGGPVCDGLAESGWPITRVSNGSTPQDPEHFANKGAEIWFQARTLIEEQKVILPNDRELIAQLTSRRGWPDSKGRLVLEPKSDLRSRNLPSPDRADAVLGCLIGLMPGHEPAKFEYETIRIGHRQRIGDALGGCRDRFPIRGMWY